MPNMLHSVDVEGMDVGELKLLWLHSIEKLDTVAMGAILVRLTAPTLTALYQYIVLHWGDRDYAAEVVYGDCYRRPFTPWDLAR